MTLIILDPNLAHPHGHHMEWDLSIASSARGRGLDVRIFAHRDCPIPSADCVEIIPWFSHTTYESKHQDRIVGKYDDFAYFNDVLAKELAAIPGDLLHSADTVLAPTLTENHLLGYVSWMKSFGRAHAPSFVVYLMFPSGLGLSEGAVNVIDPLQALFYKLAFRGAAKAGAPIHFFGSGRQMAREFSVLSGLEIETHPVPVDAKRDRPARFEARPTALLFAGDAKADKGFALLPRLADRLCAAWQNWDFVVHANRGTAWGPALKMHAELFTVIAPLHKNLKLYGERLSHEDYLRLLGGADCMVSTYDPVAYARKSSGVIWEAISCGLPMLLPARTWLESEAREWCAGYECYREFSVEGVFEGFACLVRDLSALKDRSLKAAESFLACNGAEALMDQIERVCAPRKAAATDPLPPTDVPELMSRAESASEGLVGFEGSGAGEPPRSHTPMPLLAAPPAGSGPLVSAKNVRLDEYTIGHQFSHLDLSFQALTVGAFSWPHMKFKFCLTGKGRMLEFRQAAGWPASFHNWSTANTDKYGRVIQIMDDDGISATLANYDDVHDRALLRAIAAILPIALQSLSTREEGLPGEAALWLSEANSLSRHFAKSLH
jgi:glycosyltransferase involved in cell wall biosynthesis